MASGREVEADPAEGRGDEKYDPRSREGRTTLLG